MGFMDKFRASKANRAFQRFLRVLQFLSSVISLGLFTSRQAKIMRLVNRATKSQAAVEGILVAAVLYTLAVMILTFLLERGAPKSIGWLLMLSDLLFLGAFIAVAYLTRPHGGSAGSCKNTRVGPLIPKGQNCNLPWGTFILAILSTVLHFLTLVFHEIRDHHKENKDRRGENGYSGADGSNDRY